MYHIANGRLLATIATGDDLREVSAMIGLITGMPAPRSLTELRLAHPDRPYTLDLSDLLPSNIREAIRLDYEYQDAKDSFERSDPEPPRRRGLVTAAFRDWGGRRGGHLKKFPRAQMMDIATCFEFLDMITAQVGLETALSDEREVLLPDESATRSNRVSQHDRQAAEIIAALSGGGHLQMVAEKDVQAGDIVAILTGVGIHGEGGRVIDIPAGHPIHAAWVIHVAYPAELSTIQVLEKKNPHDRVATRTVDAILRRYWRSNPHAVYFRKKTPSREPTLPNDKGAPEP